MAGPTPLINNYRQQKKKTAGFTITPAVPAPAVPLSQRLKDPTIQKTLGDTLDSGGIPERKPLPSMPPPMMDFSNPFEGHEVLPKKTGPIGVSAPAASATQVYRSHPQSAQPYDTPGGAQFEGAVGQAAKTLKAPLAIPEKNRLLTDQGFDPAVVSQHLGHPTNLPPGGLPVSSAPRPLPAPAAPAAPTGPSPAPATPLADRFRPPPVEGQAQFGHSMTDLAGNANALGARPIPHPTIPDTLTPPEFPKPAEAPATPWTPPIQKPAPQDEPSPFSSQQVPAEVNRYATGRYGDLKGPALKAALLNDPKTRDHALAAMGHAPEETEGARHMRESAAAPARPKLADRFRLPTNQESTVAGSTPNITVSPGFGGARPEAPASRRPVAPLGDGGVSGPGLNEGRPLAPVGTTALGRPAAPGGFTNADGKATLNDNATLEARSRQAALNLAARPGSGVVMTQGQDAVDAQKAAGLSPTKTPEGWSPFTVQGRSLSPGRERLADRFAPPGVSNLRMSDDAGNPVPVNVLQAQAAGASAQPPMPVSMPAAPPLAQEALSGTTKPSALSALLTPKGTPVSTPAAPAFAPPAPGNPGVAPRGPVTSPEQVAQNKADRAAELAQRNNRVEQRGAARGQARDQRLEARKSGPSLVDQLAARNPAFAAELVRQRGQTERTAQEFGFRGKQADADRAQRGEIAGKEYDLKGNALTETSRANQAREGIDKERYGAERGERAADREARKEIAKTQAGATGGSAKERMVDEAAADAAFSRYQKAKTDGQTDEATFHLSDYNARRKKLGLPEFGVEAPAATGGQLSQSLLPKAAEARATASGLDFKQVGQIIKDHAGVHPFEAGKVGPDGNMSGARSAGGLVRRITGNLGTAFGYAGHDPHRNAAAMADKFMVMQAKNPKAFAMAAPTLRTAWEQNRNPEWDNFVRTDLAKSLPAVATYITTISQGRVPDEAMIAAAKKDIERVQGLARAQ